MNETSNMSYKSYNSNLGSETVHDHTSVSYTENTKQNRDTVSEYFALGADIIGCKNYYSTISTPVYYKLPQKNNDLHRETNN